MNERFNYIVEVYMGEIIENGETFKHIRDKRAFFNKDLAKSYYNSLLKGKKESEKLRMYKRNSQKWEKIEEV